MRRVTTFPHEVEERFHVEVPMPDGCRLAARIWLPKGAEAAPVPAILEYLPYRKNDLTSRRDAPMQPYRAGHGYAVVRLDLRGAGDSEGLMRDEYLAQELQDGVDAIAWIAAQPWCDGNVGMVGISWGGFNGLQIAALRPPALKTVVTLCSTDDRYADDVHYMGGCLLSEQLTWSAVMFGRNTLPPDPANVGERWRAMWQERLQGSGLWLKNWMQHQTRDAFWKHGSICEDWSRVNIPVYAISGWADGYCRSVFRLMEHLHGPKKGLIGPWAHRYPHIGEPAPAIAYLKEELRWWDHWLKGRDTGIMDEPMLRLFMQDSVAPAGWHAERPGRWVAEPSWPSPNVVRTAWHLGGDGTLAHEAPARHASFVHASAAAVGMAAGKWCGYSNPGDAPLDQRADDGGSLCFETAPLAEAVEIAGDAAAVLSLSVDRPVAQVAVRLNDVRPDGSVTRVSYGVLNLTHRDSHETPEPLEPGHAYRVTVPLKHVAQRFPAGHRIRLAISTSYFPLILPAPDPVTLTLHSHGSALILPERRHSPQDDQLAAFGPAEAAPAAEVEVLETGETAWRICRDAITGRVEMRISDGDGTIRFLRNGLAVREQGHEIFSVDGDDVTKATVSAEWELGLSRGDWSMLSRTWSEISAGPANFRIRARQMVWEGEELVDEREWDELIPRRLV